MTASSTDNLAGMLCTHDLMFYSQVTGTARSLGKNLIGVNTVDSLLARMAQTPTSAVFLDLMLPGLDIERDVGRIREAGTSNVTILAYGPHVQVDRLQQAKTAGCDEVLPRSRFSSALNELIEQYIPAVV